MTWIHPALPLIFSGNTDTRRTSAVYLWWTLWVLQNVFHQKLFDADHAPNGGHCHRLPVHQDQQSRWIQSRDANSRSSDSHLCVPTRDVTAITAVGIFCEHWLTFFPESVFVISDDDPHFKADLTSYTTHHIVTPYSQWTNCDVECLNYTFTQCIKFIINAVKADWEDWPAWIPTIQEALNKICTTQLHRQDVLLHNSDHQKEVSVLVGTHTAHGAEQIASRRSTSTNKVIIQIHSSWMCQTFRSTNSWSWQTTGACGGKWSQNSFRRRKHRQLWPRQRLYQSLTIKIRSKKVRRDDGWSQEHVVKLVVD